MKQTVEEMVNRFEKNNDEISRNMSLLLELVEENRKLAAEIKTLSADEKDFISLARASQKYGISYATLYKRVRNGELINYSSSNIIIVKGEEIEKLMFRRLA